MKKLRCVSLWMLIMTLLITLIQIPSKRVQASEKSDKVYVKIRYNRLDKNYKDWNIWVYEKGKDGKQVDFMGEDNEGKFAVVETSKEAEQLFFIVRKGEWAEKATGEEFVDLAKGDVEVVFNQNESDIIREDKEINRNFDDLKVKLHYYKLDENYDSCKVVCTDKTLSSHEFTSEDDYGKIAEIDRKNIKDKQPISFNIIKGENEKDLEKERSIDLAYANNKEEMNIYILEGDEKVYMNSKEPIRKPEVLSLKINSINEMKFDVNYKIKNVNDIVLKENGIDTEKSKYSIVTDKDGFKGTIKFNDSIDLNKTYTMEIPKYISKNSSFGRVYDDNKFEDEYGYKGELGAIYSNNETKFILWAPGASNVKVALYGKDGKAYNCASQKTLDMVKGEKGTWYVKEPGNLDGVYYNYLVTIDGKESQVTDPYSKAVGVNGDRSMVIDLKTTNPDGWENDKRPELENPTDATIYEMHIRDFSIDENSGVTLEYRGKYKGVWQDKTTIPGSDIKTGVSHLKELGINTVQLLPAFDHMSIDETKLDKPQFNWGYDPKNFSVPEGSYSCNPYDGRIRVAEFKEMVQELHKQGIKVVMDVVYNHTGSIDSLFNLAVPDYYYRLDKDGNYSNGSGCGNETASERSMVKRLIVESVKYWATEYHIDGFRFDLMANHDIETMKTIRTELDQIDKKILMYGEGWAGGTCALPQEQQSLKINASKFGKMQLGMFSDDIRDGLKGNVFNNTEPGFLNGEPGFEDWVKFGIVASTKHDGIDYSKVKYSEKPWANEPYQTVNYNSCHDNLTLWDRLQTVNPDKYNSEIQDMNKLSAAIIFTSQGIPFIQAGEEFARTKVNDDGTLNENSFKSPDSVNKLDWKRVDKYENLYNYYRGLIKLRGEHKAFRMNTTKDIQENLKFLEKGKDFKGNNVIAYTLNGNAVGDTWDKIAVIFNSNDKCVDVTLPSENWTIVVNSDKSGTEELGKLKGKTVEIPANTSYVLVNTESYEKNNN